MNAYCKLAFIVDRSVAEVESLQRSAASRQGFDPATSEMSTHAQVETFQVTEFEAVNDCQV